MVEHKIEAKPESSLGPKNKNMKLKFKKARDEPWRGARARCQRASKGAFLATTPASFPCFGRLGTGTLPTWEDRCVFGNNLAA